METKRAWTGMVCLLGCYLSWGLGVGRAEYGGGRGSVEDPYQIWTAEQMNTIGSNSADWGKCFKLMADIDMSAYTGTQYMIIGNSSKYFSGTFDGNGHVIRNLTYTTTTATDYVGLFGYIGAFYTNTFAVIKNLGLENINISSGGKMIGGLVGWMNSQGIIVDCYTTGQVDGTGVGDFLSMNCVSGLVGKNSGGSVSNCYSTCQVTSKGYGVGGVAGSNSGTIEDCFSTGSVSAAKDYIGGLVGENGGSVTGCYSTGDVSGAGSYIGGLVGINKSPNSTSATGGVITKCYSTGNVSSSGFSSKCIGGLVGANGPDNGSLSNPKASISNCYSTGNVRGTDCQFIGGLTGDNGGIIKYSCSSGNVSAPAGRQVGGLAGRNYGGTIADCYSTGSVSGSQFVGGFIGGAHTCNVLNCYSTGAVSGGPYSVAGFLVLLNAANVVVTNCFWDTETSGLTDGGTTGASGKTTAEMKTLATFTGSPWWVNGQNGNALSFDGKMDYVEVPGYYGISGSNPRTVSMWIKTSSSIDSQRLIWWGKTPTTGSYWAMSITSDGKIAASGVSGLQTVTDEQWHHIAAVVLEGQDSVCQTFLYIDGQLDATSSSTIDTPASEPVRLGAGMRNVLSFYYKGLMDDVRIYDRGLGPNEIIPDNLPAEGLVAHWAMDETKGTVAHDSASSYDAALKNFGWDFVNGTNDNLEHIWFIREGLDYPRFVWEDQEPVADAGEDITTYLGFEGNFVDVALDGSGSSDADGDTLTYSWYLGDTLLADGVNPTVSLPAGEHVITLIVCDGVLESQPEEVEVTVVGPVWANMRITPHIFSLNGQERFVWAILKMPSGISLYQLDRSFGYFILPGQVRAKWFWHISGQVPQVIARFEREQLRPYLQQGRMRLTFYGRLNDGRYIGGSANVYVLDPPDKQ